MTMEEMKKRKKELGFSNAKLAEVSGVPLGTVQKILSGKTTSPRYDTVRALEKALASEPYAETARRISTTSYVDTESGQPINMLRDSAAYRVRNEVEKQELPRWNPHRVGDKTLEDYLALPRDVRVELIDGYFSNMSAPSVIHQMIGGEILYALKEHVRKNGGSCIPFVAPTDVQLDCDDKTMVQPDVLVVCDRSKVTRQRIEGAPDLIVEVLSTSHWYNDMILKMRKYRNAGVREYWIVVPEQQAILVYHFEKTAEAAQYTFEDQVPVGIWDGKCKVDFKKILENIQFLL